MDSSDGEADAKELQMRNWSSSWMCLCIRPRLVRHEQTDATIGSHLLPALSYVTEGARYVIV